MLRVGVFDDYRDADADSGADAETERFADADTGVRVARIAKKMANPTSVAWRAAPRPTGQRRQAHHVSSKGCRGGPPPESRAACLARYRDACRPNLRRKQPESHGRAEPLTPNSDHRGTSDNTVLCQLIACNVWQRDDVALLVEEDTAGNTLPRHIPRPIAR